MALHAAHVAMRAAHTRDATDEELDYRIRTEEILEGQENAERREGDVEQ